MFVNTGCDWDCREVAACSAGSWRGAAGPAELLKGACMVGSWDGVGVEVEGVGHWGGGEVTVKLRRHASVGGTVYGASQNKRQVEGEAAADSTALRRCEAGA